MSYQHQVVIMSERIPRPFTRELRRSLHRWIRRKQSLEFLPRKQIAYRLLLAPTREGAELLCRIVVRIGDHFWKSEARADSASGAYLQALAQLKTAEI